MSKTPHVVEVLSLNDRIAEWLRALFDPGYANIKPFVCHHHRIAKHDGGHFKQVCLDCARPIYRARGLQSYVSTHNGNVEHAMRMENILLTGVSE